MFISSTSPCIMLFKLKVIFLANPQWYIFLMLKLSTSTGLFSGQIKTAYKWKSFTKSITIFMLIFNKEPRVNVQSGFAVFLSKFTKSFLSVVYNYCYSLIWYLIFFYMLRYFVIIFLPSFVSCAYTNYTLLFYFMCVSYELVFNFSKKKMMCMHQVHLDLMFKYISVYSQNISKFHISLWMLLFFYER